jgi:hypothetical protein
VAFRMVFPSCHHPDLLKQAVQVAYAGIVRLPAVVLVFPINEPLLGVTLGNSGLIRHSACKICKPIGTCLESWLKADNRVIFSISPADWLREREHVVTGPDDPDE